MKEEIWVMLMNNLIRIQLLVIVASQTRWTPEVENPDYKFYGIIT